MSQALVLLSSMYDEIRLNLSATTSEMYTAKTPYRFPSVVDLVFQVM